MNNLLTLPGRRKSSTRFAGTDLRLQMISPLTQLLRQLASVIQRLDDRQYTQKPVGVIESSVGGHVRHCLDHVRALLAAVESGHLDYDHRERDTPIESLRPCAIAAIDDMIQALDSLPRFVITRPLSVSVSMSSDQPPVSVLSSVGRELAYVLSHTIHHNAIVNAMVKTLGAWVPERFGYAPSTIRNLESSKCVR
jgi:uncharacterized damage-inducible protein DinB